MAIVRFGAATFDPGTGEIHRDGTIVRLEPQPAALLALLAARRGTLVTHDDIARHVWPVGTHVNFQDGVHYAIRQIRVAIGDTARPPRVIETLPRRGYRLRTERVAPPDAEAAVPSAPRPMMAGSRWRRRLAAAGVAAALAAGVALLEQRPNDHHARAVAWLAVLHDLVY